MDPEPALECRFRYGSCYLKEVVLNSMQEISIPDLMIIAPSILGRGATRTEQHTVSIFGIV
jgi:hypothetical protein